MSTHTEYRLLFIDLTLEARELVSDEPSETPSETPSVSI